MQSTINDIVKKQPIFIGSIFVLISRLPFLFGGPGNDPDAFRLISVARDIIQEGQYTYSRPPGYPLYEYMMAIFIPAGSFATNLVSALFSVAGFVFFALILKTYKVQSYLMGALAFAFVPIIFINSISTMDYIPAISFIMVATYTSIKRRPVLSGILLGLAVGCRITSGAMLLPLIIITTFTTNKKHGLVNSILLTIATLSTSFICFIPVFLKYGAGFMTFADNQVYPEFGEILDKMFVDVWGDGGIVALLLLAGTIVYRFFKKQNAVVDRKQKIFIFASAVAILLYTIAFLRLPHEPAYLIPAVPFLLMILFILTSHKWIRVAAIIIIIYGFYPLWNDFEERIESRQRAKNIIVAVNNLPDRSLIVVGWELPELQSLLKDDLTDGKQFIYLIDEDKWKTHSKDFEHLYYLPEMNKWSIKISELDLNTLGGKLLQVPGDD